MKFSEIANRLTGISSPFGGASMLKAVWVETVKVALPESRLGETDT
jgi:hypothetical protein